MRENHVIGCPGWLLFFLIVGVPLYSESLVQENEDLGRAEEAVEYYEKWLREDVVFIITPEEKGVFESLTTPEEKEHFIEQFWFRRDPEPRTANNEFKEEHYRRIAYANENFTSGYEGWRNDRGRIYIIHGPPDELEAHPGAGRYRRPDHEGGGTTSVYPFEIWRYRHIEGIGSNVLLEFVDPSLSGEYYLTHSPDEKDALIHMSGMGLTDAEEMGLTDKANRPYYTGSLRSPFLFYEDKYDPFNRYLDYTQALSPKPIKFQDLKQLVDLNLQYESIPIVSREDCFRLNETEVLVPITIELQNKDLSFAPDTGEAHVARLAVYGRITSITHRIVSEFDDEVLASFPADRLEAARGMRSVYQKLLPLNRGTRYKLDLVVKDLNSGKIGVAQKVIVPPPYLENQLQSSSLIISKNMRLIGEAEEGDMFVLGDVKVRPNLSREFSPQTPLGLYFQLYNVTVDQSTSAPSLAITYRIINEGTTAKESLDTAGESIHFYSRGRIVVVNKVDLSGLKAGGYTIQVEVEDLISQQDLVLAENFTLIDKP